MTYLFPFLKMFGDIALWLACGSVVMSLFSGLSNLLPVAVAAGLGAAMADFLGQKHEKLRYLGMIPSVAALLLCHSVGDVFLALPPMAYLFLCVHRQTLQPDGAEMSFRFKLWAVISIISCVGCIARHVDWGFLCSILGMVSSVFLMRMLRHDAYDLQNRRLMAMELGLLAVVAGLCVLLSRKAVLAAGLQVLKLGYNTFIYPIFLLLVTVSVGALYVVQWVMNFFAGRGPEASEAGKNQETMRVMEQYFDAVETTEHPILVLILRIVGAVIFLYVAYRVFRALADTAVKRTDPKRSTEERYTVPIPRARDWNTPGVLDRSAEARVRRAYAAYTRTVNDTMRRLQPGDTTRTVNIAASLESDPEAVELRRLYLLARYEKKGVLKSEDGHSAAALSKSLCAKVTEAAK